MIRLIACVAKKADAPAPARLLYQSDWFRLARAYAESTGEPWFILSARHGLVAPDDVIAPYNLSLIGMASEYRQSWAHSVICPLKARRSSACKQAGEPHADPMKPLVGDAFEILAGAKYRELLVPLLTAYGATVTVPMAGLAIGQQMAWMKAATTKEVVSHAQ